MMVCLIVLWFRVLFRPIFLIHISSDTKTAVCFGTLTKY